MTGYSFETIVGTFSIKAEAGRVWLDIDETPLSSFAYPESAVAAVHRHETGWRPWDDLRGWARAPRDLSDWEHMRAGSESNADSTS